MRNSTGALPQLVCAIAVGLAGCPGDHVGAGDPRRSGDWSRLELSLLPLANRRPPKWLKQQAVVVKHAIPQIRECLRESAIARAEMPEWVAYLFATHEDGRIGMHPAVPMRSDDELTACLRSAVGDHAAFPSDPKRRHSVELAVKLPESGP
jgi:hypothetical protein